MRDRAADPSRVNQCPDCALDVLPTELGIAEHRAKHMDWLANPYLNNRKATPPEIGNQLQAWRHYAKALERFKLEQAATIHDLHDRINTRDDCIQQLEWDLNAAHTELDDLRRQLNAARA